jgi:hypothetical protein
LPAHLEGRGNTLLAHHDRGVGAAGKFPGHDLAGVGV